MKPESAEVEIKMSVEADPEHFDNDVDDDRAMAKQVCLDFTNPFISLYLLSSACNMTLSNIPRYCQLRGGLSYQIVML